MNIIKYKIEWKSIILFVVSIFLIFMLAGCTVQNPPNTSEKPGKEEPAKEENPKPAQNSVDAKLKDKVKIVDVGALPDEAKEWFEKDTNKEGAYVYQHPDATYIKLVEKEKPTGGYAIHIKDYLEEEYPRMLEYEVLEPEKDGMVTQALTTPTVILQITSDMVSQYEVKNAKGELLKVEEKLEWAKLEVPKEGDKIISPVKVKGKIIAFEGAFVVRILDKDDKIIHETHLQADAGGPAWGSFDTEISFPKTDSKTGSIELGEFSAEDGSYLLRKKIGVTFSE